MSDPRAVISFEGIAGRYATYKVDNSTIVYDATKERGSASVDLAVGLSADRTLELVADAEAIVGKLLRVDNDNFATVQVGGYMTLPGGSSAALTRGKTVIGALGASSAKGYIREAASGTAAELVKARGQIEDVSDTTNVVVLF